MMEYTQPNIVNMFFLLNMSNSQCIVYIDKNTADILFQSEIISMFNSVLYNTFLKLGVNFSLFKEINTLIQ